MAAERFVRLALVAIGALALACDRTPPGAASPLGVASVAPANVDAGPGAEPANEAPSVTLHLVAARGPVLLATMEEIGGEPVLVDARALDAIGCVSVDIDEPGTITPSRAVAKIAEAVRARGLLVEHAEKRWLVGLPPEGSAAVSCAPIRETEADLTDAERDEILRAIRQVSPTERTITRRGLDRIREHLAALERDTRVVPQMEDGGVTGIRLFGIKADSVFGKLGLENGDVLRRLMGRPMTTPEQALDAYAAIVKASVITVDLVRRGAPVTLTIRVVP